MNTNKLHSVFSKALVGVMFIYGSLLATDASDQSEVERITVGDRAMTQVERVKVQEKRARLFKMIENGEDLSDEEDVELSDAEQQEAAGQGGEIAQGEEQGDEASIEASKLTKKGVNATTYYTTHEGAFHNPLAVSLLGDSIELEDGSIWAVCFIPCRFTIDQAIISPI